MRQSMIYFALYLYDFREERCLFEDLTLVNMSYTTGRSPEQPSGSGLNREVLQRTAKASEARTLPILASSRILTTLQDQTCLKLG